MIKSSTGEVCSPNDDIKALDLHGTNALRARLLQIQADSGSGEEALYAEAEIVVGAERAEVEQTEADKIEQAARAEQEKQAAEKALSDFRIYLEQCSGFGAGALPKDSELAYNYNPVTQECEITRLDGEPIVLKIAYSRLRGVLPLPPQLMVAELHCSNNYLTTLPEVLPTSLTVLDCGDNQLSKLPEVLPASLTELRCSTNQLTTLPEVLPTSLTVLNCGGNQLTKLPEVLPVSLTKLDCSTNQLTKLPEVLPVSLTKLDCSTNQLTTLPELLKSSLTWLDYVGNPNLHKDKKTRVALRALRRRGAVVLS